MTAPDTSINGPGVRSTEANRPVLGFVAAVLGATIGGTFGITVTLGGTAPIDIAVTMLFVAVYSMVIVGIVGPISHWLLRRLQVNSLVAYTLTGTLLGGSIMAAVSGRTSPADPFVFGGLLAGLCAGLCFRAVYRAPKGAA